MFFHSNKELSREIADKVLLRGALEGKPYGDLIQEEVQRIFELEEISMGVIEPLKFDKNGRIKFNPGLHHNQSKAWTHGEIVYLIEWYNKIGVEEMSLSLGRSEGTVHAKAVELRRAGLLSRIKKPKQATVLPRPKRKSNYIPTNKKRGRTCKLRKEDIERIIELKESKTLDEIAKLYNVSKSTIVRQIRLYKRSL